MNILDIKNPDFLKDYNLKQIKVLCHDIRQYLLKNIPLIGGHFSSNLGAIELIVMLHKHFDFTKDKIFFDIGHQTYTHKILIGQIKRFNTLRKFKGIPPFQKLNDTKYDHWEAGHAGTSIGAAVGYAETIEKTKEVNILSFIGDASISNGLALEALNDLGHRSKKKVIIILNDNGMSISKNTNFLTSQVNKTRLNPLYSNIIASINKLGDKNKIFKYLNNLQKKQEKFIKTNISFFDFFKFFNLDYLGPFDGHNLRLINDAFKKAKLIDSSIIIHFKTQKGRGLSSAEQDTDGSFHSIKINKAPYQKNNSEVSWSEAVTNLTEKLMLKNKNIAAITPGMIQGSKLNNIFQKFPSRSYDVGIAEGHAVLLGCGMALNKYKPIIYIYSTFLQRAYDQLIHDANSLNLPITFIVDRCGLATGDGRTHHGLYDINLLHNLDNSIIFSPYNYQQLKIFVNSFVVQNNNKLIFIRIPKANIIMDNDFKISNNPKIGEWIYDFKQILAKQKIIISYGADFKYIKDMIKKMHLEGKFALVNAIFLKPFDVKLIQQLVELKKDIIIFEKQYYNSGLAMIISSYFNLKLNQKFHPIVWNIKQLKQFEEGSEKELLQETDISEEAIINNLLKC